MKKLLFLTALLTISSCASVKFYSDKEFKNEDGLKFYNSKPYLLVENLGEEKKPLKTSIIYLPDYSNPIYAKIRNGFGSSDLKLSLENSIITSYGVNTDSKIPETISSVGSAFKSIAEGAKVLAETGDTEMLEALKNPSIDLYEIKISSTGTQLIKIKIPE